MEKEEIWKDIKGYEGLYQVSNFGRVKSVGRTVRCGNSERFIKERILKPAKRWNGSLQVGLSKKGISQGFCVATLVATAFTPNPQKHKYVRHIDGNMNNDHCDNLEWFDFFAVKKAAEKKYRKPVVKIDPYSMEVVERYPSIAIAAAENNLSPDSVSYALRSRRVYNGYLWKYQEDLK